MARSSTTVLSVALSALVLAPAQAQDAVREFYQGRQMQLQVGSAAGGSYDTVGRAVARHIHRHIPGNPTIIVQNVPGGGSLQLANRLYNIVAKDGSVFAIVNNGVATTPLLSPEAAYFDASRFSWIGSTSREAHILIVWHDAPAQTFEDLFETEIILGATAPGAGNLDYALVTNALLGTKIKIISGYGGAGDIVNIAMPRGEVHGIAGYSWGSMKTGTGEALLKEQKVKVLAQYGRGHREIPDVPSFGYGKTESDRQIFELIYARQEYGRPFLTPPDVPSERVAALREAFAVTMKDTQFLSDAEKLNIEIDPVAGDYLQELTERLVATPKDVLAKAHKILDLK